MRAAIGSRHKTLSAHGRREDEEQDIVDVFQWDVRRVALWLSQLGFSKPAAKSEAAGVDGAILLEMDADAWSELGVTSALDRARIHAALKKATLRHPTASQTAPPMSEQKSVFNGRDFSEFEETMYNHFISWRSSRTPEGGAEHRIGWMLSVCNANRSAGEVKQHALRFVSMYNVVCLLVATIGLTYLYTADISGTGPKSWAGVAIYFFTAWCSVFSCSGVVASAILYNICSAVGDDNFIMFAKMPSTLSFFKYVNDASILCGMSCLLCLPFLFYRTAIEIVEPVWRMYPGGPPLDGKWYYTGIVVAIPSLYGLRELRRHIKLVIICTHAVLYGGLMSDKPVAPLANDPLWAHRSSPEQIAEYVCTQAVLNGQPQKPSECEAHISRMYAEQLVNERTDDFAALQQPCETRAVGRISTSL
eukprot:TRINITY_DN82170_c0_g1_i1.p1 TRINITY_DN82170_c0_g1~~TRINITY_DN82170_c0_g1_i1.p1  ORF type:complete len:419 (+),score=58.98 TRINITY_DN82170_c0_g1_i1:48-1304(+)